MNRITRTLVAAGAITLSLGATSMAPAQAQTKYSNCTALHRDFKHGVARSKAAANRQVRDGYGRPAFGRHARDVYWANHANLDRDKDGTACEA
jgi:hypothetical protein